MQTSTLWGVIVVVVIALGVGIWYMQGGNAPASNTGQTATTTPDTTGTSVNAGVDVSVGAPLSATVTYGANGFSPKPVTIKKGGTVIWNGPSTMWVASAQHPTHTAYSGTSLQEHCDDATDTSFDQCETGSTYSFTFNKVGTWNYHDHRNPSNFGSVVVVE